jgi:hypothetical protein
MSKPGLWDNIHAKKERIRRGSKEHMKRPGEKGRPTDADFKSASRETINETIKRVIKNSQAVAKLKDALLSKKVILQNADKKQRYDMINNIMTKIANAHSKSNQEMHDMWTNKYKEIPDTWILEENWSDVKHQNPTGGLKKSGVMAYRREHPGSNLQTAVTTPPSKLEKGSKAANRRKSFCARMSGMKSKLTSAKTANDPNSRINKSLRKWNC